MLQFCQASSRLTPCAMAERNPYCWCCQVQIQSFSIGRLHTLLGSPRPVQIFFLSPPEDTSPIFCAAFVFAFQFIATSSRISGSKVSVGWPQVSQLNTQLGAACCYQNARCYLTAAAFTYVAS